MQSFVVAVRRAFLSWQKELGEHLELARRACHVWRKIEDYAAAHFPEMLPTLRQVSCLLFH